MTHIEVREYLSQNPQTPLRTLASKTGTSEYMLKKWEKEGLIKLYRSKPSAKNGWMGSLGRLKK